MKSASDNRVPIKSLTFSDIEKRFTEIGEPKYRAKQVVQWLYQKRAKSFSGMTDLSARLRESLEREYRFDSLELIRKTGSRDTTCKFLFRLDDGNLIESVLVPASPALFGEGSDRQTVCVSTQVGCAYGCKFCASGLEGFVRNLEAGEMVDQILRVEEIEQVRVQNIVFMGMGEPLANYDHLMRAIEIINSPLGIGIGARHITISTSGLAPQIRALAEQPLQIRLAVSLHGATDAVRNQIMPVNRKYPLKELLDACTWFARQKKQRITFEFILIEGLNDSPEQAQKLAAIACRFGANVNLIPYNCVEGLPWKCPSESCQSQFLRLLEKEGVSATIRREKGDDIQAACGQLRLQSYKFPIQSFCRIEK